jgi:hypothetical protein
MDGGDEMRDTGKTILGLKVLLCPVPMEQPVLRVRDDIPMTDQGRKEKRT